RAAPVHAPTVRLSLYALRRWTSCCLYSSIPHRPDLSRTNVKFFESLSLRKSATFSRTEKDSLMLFLVRQQSDGLGKSSTGQEKRRTACYNRGRAAFCSICLDCSRFQSPCHSVGSIGAGIQIRRRLRRSLAVVQRHSHSAHGTDRNRHRVYA